MVPRAQSPTNPDVSVERTLGEAPWRQKRIVEYAEVKAKRMSSRKNCQWTWTCKLGSHGNPKDLAREVLAYSRRFDRNTTVQNSNVLAPKAMVIPLLILAAHTEL
jgi:hypothetical protein